MTTAENEAPLVDEATAKLGRRVFLQCRSCHALKQNERHKVGPNLYGFYRQPAGSREGYDRYSQALNDAEHVWDDEALNAFLQAPSDWLPGTTMAFRGLAKAEDRTAIIAYLRQQTAVTTEAR